MVKTFQNIPLTINNNTPVELGIIVDLKLVIDQLKGQGLIGESSFSIILPKAYAINLRIEKGDFVKVREEGKLIIEKV